MTKLLDPLAEDFALAAWARVKGEAAEPESFEVVSDSGFPFKTALYRLRGAGPDGVDAIAKRSRVTKAAIERAVYEQVLPGIPVRSLRYFGAAEERGSRFCWLFFEDGRGEPFERRRDEHRALRDGWLAALHIGASELPRPADVPRSGPAEHFESLQLAQKDIARCLLLDELAPAERRVLRAAFVQLDFLEGRWTEVAASLAGVPETLQYGHLTGKNLIVDPAGALVPLNWEAARWGPPAIDLTFVDPARYHAHVATHLPELSVEAIERAAAAGRIFRHLLGIRWATRDYPAERSKRKLADQHAKLEDDLRTAGLT